MRINQLGSRLVVKNDANSDRIGLRLTQSGAVVGIQRRLVTRCLPCVAPIFIAGRGALTVNVTKVLRCS